MANDKLVFRLCMLEYYLVTDENVWVGTNGLLLDMLLIPNQNWNSFVDTDEYWLVIIIYVQVEVQIGRV